jgi:hypothetical protein
MGQTRKSSGCRTYPIKIGPPTDVLKDETAETHTVPVVDKSNRIRFHQCGKFGQRDGRKVCTSVTLGRVCLPAHHPRLPPPFHCSRKPTSSRVAIASINWKYAPHLVSRCTQAGPSAKSGCVLSGSVAVAVGIGRRSSPSRRPKPRAGGHIFRSRFALVESNFASDLSLRAPFPGTQYMYVMNCRGAFPAAGKGQSLSRINSISEGIHKARAVLEREECLLVTFVWGKLKPLLTVHAWPELPRYSHTRSERLVLNVQLPS